VKNLKRYEGIIVIQMSQSFKDKKRQKRMPKSERGTGESSTDVKGKVWLGCH
jgi:hypothetical protein